MTPESLTRSLAEFLAASQTAVVVEDGNIAFDLSLAKYSISGEHNKCLLHLWSSERNFVRRVVDSELKHDTLKLAVLRAGQSRASTLEICRTRDRRTPNDKRKARMAYERKLRLTIERRYPGFSVGRFSSAVDLERSFGPVYARGLIRQGQSAFAVLGANRAETQNSIDAALTFGILWMDACRSSSAGKFVVEGLKLYLPTGTSAVACERMAHLDPVLAKWQLFEYEETEDSISRVDLNDRGNLATRLTQCLDEKGARHRFAQAIAQVKNIMPDADVAFLSPAQVSFRYHGLEFARADLTHDLGPMRGVSAVVFGMGAEQSRLCGANHDAFVGLARSIGEVRHAEGPKDHPFWRLHPERWLESLIAKNVAAVDQRLDSAQTYAQVPAFSASDRAMMDVLTITQQGRLAVLELKAGEDIHLPLQGLDYWSRVAWHHARGEFTRFGYFPGTEVSPQPPLLYLVAPAFHIHPRTDALLRYLSPEIEWVLAGIDERWRDRLNVVFRKRQAKTFSRRPVPNPNQDEGILLAKTGS